MNKVKQLNLRCSVTGYVILVDAIAFSILFKIKMLKKDRMLGGLL